MNRLYIGAFFAAIGFSAWACKGDPTASLRGGPTALDISPTNLFIDSGTTKSLEVIVRDAQTNPLAVAVNVTSANSGVATVDRDTSKTSPDGSSHAYVVTAVGLDRTNVNVTSGGLSGAAEVTVLPIVFGGASSADSLTSPDTVQGGDVIRIHSTAKQTFDIASATATFAAGAGPAGTVIGGGVDFIDVIVPYGPPGTVRLSGITLTYGPGAYLVLQSKFRITQRGSRWAGNGSFATAPAISASLPGPAGGKYQLVTDIVPADSVNCFDGVPCALFQFTLADTATYSFVTDWDNGADMDAYLCDAATNCFIEGGSGATAAQPEKVRRFLFAAGTYWYAVERFDGPVPHNVFLTITRP